MSRDGERRVNVAFPGTGDKTGPGVAGSGQPRSGHLVEVDQLAMEKMATVREADQIRAQGGAFRPTERSQPLIIPRGPRCPSAQASSDAIAHLSTCPPVQFSNFRCFQL